MKNSIRRIFWVMCICLFALIFYVARLVLVERESISTNSYNLRLRYENQNLQRGDILDRNGVVLATSVKNDNGDYVRSYPKGSLMAHVTGYSTKGKTGIEANKNFEMTKLTNEFSQRINQIVTDEELIGNDVVLTVDWELQKLAGDLLGTAKGAIVAIEPSTGKVLALQSYPNFDPNTLNEQWTNLNSNENSPLINRGTQGLYPPGSTFKIISALTIMRNMNKWEDARYICVGSAEFEDKVINCYNNTAHGDIGLLEAMEKSCNCYFAEMLTAIPKGNERLQKAMNDSGINSTYTFELANSKNRMNLDKNSSESLLVETSIGQGETAVTPLYMASLISGIANDGIMMKPYIVERIVDYKGNNTKVYMPEKLEKIATFDEAESITEMLIAVVESGTGTLAKVNGISVAGKTGTAQNATENDHSWFVAFAPAENPEVAVAVIVENIDNYGSAVPIARQIIQKVLEMN